MGLGSISAWIPGWRDWCWGGRCSCCESAWVATDVSSDLLGYAPLYPGGDELSLSQASCCASRFVTRIHPLRAVEGELTVARVAGAVEGIQQECVVIPRG